MEQQGLDRTFDFAIYLNNWSVMMQSAGQHRMSAVLSERAVSVARQADSENGASLTMLAAWGNALTTIGDFARARVALDESLVKARAAGSLVRLLNTLQQSVVLATEAGDVDRASRFTAEAEGALTDSSPPLLKATVEILRGRVALASGHPQEAIDRTKRGLDLLIAANPTQQSVLPTQTFLARSLNASGRFSEALDSAGRSVDVARGRLGGFRYSSTVGSALLEQAAAHHGLGHTDQARAAVREALEHLNDTLGPQSMTTIRAKMLLASLTVPSQ
jgi:tetratricopeptide (TPR) repeat protein